MKSSWTQLGVILLLAGTDDLVFERMGADWKELPMRRPGTFYYDAASIRSPSAGLRGCGSTMSLNTKQVLIEFNCRGGSYRVLDLVEYDEADASRTAMTIPTILTG